MYPKATKKLIWLYILLGAILFGIVVGWLISWGVQVTHNVQVLQQDAKATSKEKFDASLEISKAIVSGIGTIATIIGGIVLYLNFRVANRNTELAESRLIAERFSKAVEQLSSKDLEVRLGGIYALGSIAKDSVGDSRASMEVLAAFIREKSLYVDPKYNTEIQAILTVLGGLNAERKIEKPNLSLKGANLSGFVLVGDFANIDFSEAHLLKADPSRANLSDSDLRDANLTNANLSGANLTNSDLRDANLNSANLNKAKLGEAKFKGAFLYNADFRGAEFNKTDFSNTHLRGSIFKGTNLENSIFENSIFWDYEDWEKRHWDDEKLERYYDHLAEQELDSMEPEAGFDDDAPHQWKADFRQSNITVSQVESAKKWEKAIYDKALSQVLGLPDYRVDEVREEI